jgi:pimeloyl-ACP methyl ester carboxylesterase
MPATTDDTSIHPFHVDIPESDLDDLRHRLARTRWPEDAPSPGWEYGIPLGYVRELAEYWRTAYDWRKHEARLNEFAQYTTNIDRQLLHFVHVRSPQPDALPLIITHGWPGTVAEFINVIEPLADPRRHGGAGTDAFHVVAPSIPGFALSGPTTEPGWDVKRVAAAFAELMRRLGYDRYGAQGGDWGSAISRQIGLLEPDHVLGVHLNMLFPPASVDAQEMAELTDKEKASVEAAGRFRQQGSGYFMIQSSRPQTLAYGLTDSPVGQLAWIAEKFMEWTDSAAYPEDAVDRDQLLTNVSLYWFTRTANSSARLYYETMHSAASRGQVEPSNVPTGVAVFPREIAPPIRRFAERSNNIVHWSEFDRGGHFAAMEEPDLLVDDLRTFFRRLRGQGGQSR